MIKVHNYKSPKHEELYINEDHIYALESGKDRWNQWTNIYLENLVFQVTETPQEVIKIISSTQ